MQDSMAVTCPLPLGIYKPWLLPLNYVLIIIIIINYHFTFIIIIHQSATVTIQFSGSTHATKPSDDPNSRVPTPDEFVADFKMFVEASFCVADQLSMN